MSGEKRVWLTLVNLYFVIIKYSLGQAVRGSLIWEDNFDTVINRDKWRHVVTGWRGANEEFQYYTNNPSNSFTKNGTLYIKPTLTADQYGQTFLYNGSMNLELFGCNNNWKEGCTLKVGADIIHPVQTARIESTEKYGITMGSIVEVRAQMPIGDWLLPSIVMLPINSSYGKWPRSGEMDIVQVRSNAYLTCNGLPYGRQRAESSLIWQSGWNILNIYNRVKFSADPDFSSVYHTYRLEWLSSGISFYIDDALVGIVTPEMLQLADLSAALSQPVGLSIANDIPRLGMAPFDQKFRIVINLSVGGNMFGDDCINGGFKKPWSRDEPAKMKSFWEKRAHWLPTWNINSDQSAFKVDYVKVFLAL